MACTLYVQAKHRTVKTNSNVTRMLDTIIYLCSLAQNQQQGEYELMDLNSGKLITQNIVHQIPATDDVVVIRNVETMAYNQGFKSLKLRTDVELSSLDADWIAGVDYDEQQRQRRQ